MVQTVAEFPLFEVGLRFKICVGLRFSGDGFQGLLTVVDGRGFKVVTLQWVPFEFKSSVRVGFQVVEFRSVILVSGRRCSSSGSVGLVQAFVDWWVWFKFWFDLWFCFQLWFSGFGAIFGFDGSRGSGFYSSSSSVVSSRFKLWFGGFEGSSFDSRFLGLFRVWIGGSGFVFKYWFGRFRSSFMCRAGCGFVVMIEGSGGSRI